MLKVHQSGNHDFKWISFVNKQFQLQIYWYIFVSDFFVDGESDF
jgi:hypothetical protein